jgi:hypothetical protein
MQLYIPPPFFYAIGAVLVVFGALRAKYLGAPRPPRVPEDDAGAAPDAAPARGKEQHRHLRMGVLWVLLGLFLIVSTYLQSRRR